MSTTTSFRKRWRNSSAIPITRTHASGSLPFTWKIGACTMRATSVGYSVDRASTGAVVNPIPLFTTTWIVPPVR